MLAIYIAYIGGGVNIYQYCCDACKSYGHDMFNSVSCCEVHQQSSCASFEHNDPENFYNSESGYLHCSMVLHSGNHCDVKHFEAPILQNVSIESIDFSSPLVAILTIFSFEDEVNISNFSVSISSDCRFLPFYGGRGIITSKSSYLI